MSFLDDLRQTTPKTQFLFICFNSFTLNYSAVWRTVLYIYIYIYIYVCHFGYVNMHIITICPLGPLGQTAGIAQKYITSIARETELSFQMKLENYKKKNLQS